jgi:hypothetical protein
MSNDETPNPENEIIFIIDDVLKDGIIYYDSFAKRSKTKQQLESYMGIKRALEQANKQIVNLGIRNGVKSLKLYQKSVLDKLKLKQSTNQSFDAGLYRGYKEAIKKIEELAWPLFEGRGFTKDFQKEFESETIAFDLEECRNCGRKWSAWTPDTLEYCKSCDEIVCNHCKSEEDCEWCFTSGAVERKAAEENQLKKAYDEGLKQLRDIGWEVNEKQFTMDAVYAGQEETHTWEISASEEMLERYGDGQNLNQKAVRERVYESLKQAGWDMHFDESMASFGFTEFHMGSHTPSGIDRGYEDNFENMGIINQAESFDDEDEGVCKLCGVRRAALNEACNPCRVKKGLRPYVFEKGYDDNMYCGSCKTKMKGYGEGHYCEKCDNPKITKMDSESFEAEVRKQNTDGIILTIPIIEDRHDDKYNQNKIIERYKYEFNDTDIRWDNAYFKNKLSNVIQFLTFDQSDKKIVDKIIGELKANGYKVSKRKEHFHWLDYYGAESFAAEGNKMKAAILRGIQAAIREEYVQFDGKADIAATVNMILRELGQLEGDTPVEMLDVGSAPAMRIDPYDVVAAMARAANQMAKINKESMVCWDMEDMFLDSDTKRLGWGLQSIFGIHALKAKVDGEDAWRVAGYPQAIETWFMLYNSLRINLQKEIKRVKKAERESFYQAFSRHIRDNPNVKRMIKKNSKNREKAKEVSKNCFPAPESKKWVPVEEGVASKAKKLSDALNPFASETFNNTNDSNNNMNSLRTKKTSRFNSGDVKVLTIGVLIGAFGSLFGNFLTKKYLGPSVIVTTNDDDDDSQSDNSSTVKESDLITVSQNNRFIQTN